MITSSHKLLNQIEIQETGSRWAVLYCLACPELDSVYSTCLFTWFMWYKACSEVLNNMQ